MAEIAPERPFVVRRMPAVPSDQLMRDIAEGRTLGDTTTLADPSVVASLKEQYEAEES